MKVSRFETKVWFFQVVIDDGVCATVMQVSRLRLLSQGGPGELDFNGQALPVKFDG